MESIQNNPYRAPQVADSASRVKSPPVPWQRWVVVAVTIQLAVTVGSIYVDRISTGIDSFILCCWLTGIGLFVFSLLIGAKHECRNAIRLGQIVNFSVWLTMLATAHVAVPAMLGGAVGIAIYPVFTGIWITSAAVSILLTYAVGKKFNKVGTEADI